MGYSAMAINGVAIRNPTDLTIEYYTITQAGRVATGDMVMDYVASKRTFELTYSHITSTDLNTILDILWTNLATTKQCFHTLTYLDDGVTKTATVYAGAIPKKLHCGQGAQWVWKNVTFSLIEK